MLVYPVFSNYYGTAASGERFLCHAVPTEYRERQHSFTTWGVYPASCLDPLKIKRTNVRHAEFFVENPASNIVYRGAIYTNTFDSWLNNERGYMYGLRLQDVKRKTGWGRTRLYLIGSDAPNAFSGGQDYRNQLNLLPWIQMEMTFPESGSVTNEEAAIGNLHIRGKVAGEVVNEYTENRVNFPGLEGELSNAHEWGVLLSQNYLVAYTRNSAKSMFFTENRYDLTRFVDTNDFRNVWVLIENEFATREQVEPLLETDQLPLAWLSVKVQAFSIKEPTTYAISVVNTKITDPVRAGSQVMTWLFQTGFPDQGVLGRHCMLDTFGTEPVSLKKERRGELKE
jgi:hypothetical protein